MRSVVNELVAISVMHGASKPIDLCVELADGDIEGRVDDHGPGTRAMARAKEKRDDSFVLRIIEGFVDEWRVSQDGIWFRMSATPGPL
jgi:anti-sigma regulatory factor (Ser/Thr protein kinase)